MSIIFHVVPNFRVYSDQRQKDWWNIHRDVMLLSQAPPLLYVAVRCSDWAKGNHAKSQNERNTKQTDLKELQIPTRSNKRLCPPGSTHQLMNKDKVWQSYTCRMELTPLTLSSCKIGGDKEKPLVGQFPQRPEVPVAEWVLKVENIGSEGSPARHKTPFLRTIWGMSGMSAGDASDLNFTKS